MEDLRPPATSLSADRRLAALFPDETTVAPNRRRRRLTAFFGGVAVVALVVGLLLTTGAFGSSGASYVTATAGPATVDARQTGVATIEPVSQATVAFPVSGTVASVNVALGQSVQAGGTLASLDTTSLMTTLHTKQSALAQSQLTLSKALSGQSVSLGSGGGGASGGSGGTGGSSSTSATAAAARTGTTPAVILTAAPTDPQLAADEQAVLTAQQQVDAALADAATAIAAETTACAPLSSTTPPPTVAQVTACQQAVTAVTTAQNTVASAQKALATASSTLDAYVEQKAQTPPPTSAPPATTPTPSTPSSGQGSRSGGGSSSTSGGSSGGGGFSSGSGSSRSSGSGSGASAPSAADLVAAQQSVDAATAAVNAAQQAVDQATITSPIAGAVVSLNMKVGDQVSAASSTENVVVQGTGGYQVSTTVNVDNIPQVAIGQDATVAPDGTHKTLDGKVVAISVAPASSTTSTTLYRVVVGLTDPTASLQNGATGTVSIVTKHAHAPVAVPTSAITTTGRRHFVTVVQGGNATLTPVQVGVLGSQWTQITSGLAAGQQVELADQNQPLPGSATSSSNGTQTTNPFARLGGGLGGFGGGGLRGGGGGGGGGFGGRGG
jgi:HlyD family secretion protein